MVTLREYRSPWRATHSRLGDTMAEAEIVSDLFVATAVMGGMWGVRLMLECNVGSDTGEDEHEGEEEKDEEEKNEEEEVKAEKKRRRKSKSTKRKLKGEG